MSKKKRGAAKAPDTNAVVPAGDAPPSPPAPAGTDPLTPPRGRDSLGRWVRGQSGNPHGKPKGLRNYVTRERLALEAALRAYISNEDNLPKVLDGIDRMFDIIANGEDKQAVAAFKALYDKLLTAPKDASDTSDGPNQLVVVIKDAVVGSNLPAARTIDDAEYEEIDV